MFAISCCKSQHTKSRDRQCLQPSKPSIQNKLPHQLPLATRKITYKITSETYNRVENATRECESVSLQLFVENKMTQRDCLLAELALSPCYL